MNVRRAKEQDIPALLRLLVQVNLVHHNARPDLFKGPATKYTAEELKPLLADDRRPVFVCTDEADTVLGYAFCVMQEHPDDHILTNIRTLYLDDLCVEETARGRHVGKTLFDFVRDYAKEIGCYNLTLNVWSCNPSALRFYECMGMVPQKIGMELTL